MSAQRLWGELPAKSKVLIFYSIVMAAVMLFPPFHYGTKIDSSAGHAFIFFAPEYCDYNSCAETMVNIQLLLVEMLAVSAIGLSVYMVFSALDKKREAEAENAIRAREISLTARIDAEKIILEREKMNFNSKELP